MTSSMTKSTAAIGELKAAARPAAAPRGGMSRRRSRLTRSRRATAEARPAPMWREGSSGPRECPPPMASAEVTNFPSTERRRMTPSYT
jgi:hypothetical protein